MTALMAIATVMLLIPNERHIDFTGWTGESENEFSVLITAMDGTVFKTSAQLFPGSTATTARDLVWFGLKERGWRGYTVGKGILALEGSKDSAIRSVEFRSKDWKPNVRWVALPREKK